MLLTLRGGVLLPAEAAAAAGVGLKWIWRAGPGVSTLGATFTLLEAGPAGEGEDTPPAPEPNPRDERLDAGTMACGCVSFRSSSS